MTQQRRPSCAVRYAVPVALALTAWVSPWLAAQSSASDGTTPTITIRSGTAVLTVPWKDDVALAEGIRQLSGAGGGSIEFSAGTYEFGRGMNVHTIKNVALVGRPGVVFRMRKLTEWGLIKTIGSHAPDEKLFEVDRPDLMTVGARYQLFYPDQHGNRFFECLVSGIEGSKIKLSIANVTHPSVPVIGPGAFVVPEINFLDGWQCSDIQIRDITFDGGVSIGDVKLNGQPFYGHTTHCGLVFRNAYKGTTPRPAGRNIRIEGCSFRNFLGRGAAIYNTSDVTVRDCEFESIRTEGLEIDHWSLGATIVGCSFRECGSCMQLNDCNETIVTGCRFSDSGRGIYVLDALHDLTTNRELSITGNIFTRMRDGAVVLDPHADANVIASNVFRDCVPRAVEIGGDRVVCTGNVITGSTECGVKVTGKDCVVESNSIVAPAQGAGFVAIKR